MKEFFNTVRGTIEIANVFEDKWDFIHKQHNLVTYQGADVMAKAMAGDLVLNDMYMVFENDPAAIRISEDLGNVAATYANSSANRSFVRVSTMGDPVYSSSGTNYQHNQVAFLAVTDGTSFFPAVPVTDGTSVFYHTALVAAVDDDTQSGDFIYACSDLTTDISKVAGANIGIRWTVTFDAPTP